MPQIRLTNKCAEELKVSNICKPVDTISPFDDWAINLVFIHRKKVAMITHAKSALTFLVPCQQMSGIKGIVTNIGGLLIKWLNENSLAKFVPQVKKLFAQPFVFCKVQDRRVLGRMNDFKRCLRYCEDPVFEDINWGALSIVINDIPIDVVKARECKSPKEKFLKILNCSQSQVIRTSAPQSMNLREKLKEFSHAEFTARQKNILAIIKKQKAVSVPQIMSELDTPSSQRIVTKDLNYLKHHGFVTLKRAARNSLWGIT